MEEDEDELLVLEESDNDDSNSKVSVSDKMEFIDTEDVPNFQKCVNTNDYQYEDE